MLPARDDISDVYRGDTWFRTYRLRLPDGNYRDLTGLTASAQVRASLAADGEVLAIMSVAIAPQADLATRGQFVVFLSPATSASLPAVPVPAFWDVEFATVGRVAVDTPVAGSFTWQSDVSRP